MGHTPHPDGGTRIATYTMAMEYDANNNPIIIGMALQGTAKSEAGWQVRKLTFDANNNPTNIQFANGNSGFIAIYNDWATFSYS